MGDVMTYYHFQDIVKESIGILILCSLIAVLTGQLLYSMQDQFITIPIFLVFVPVINGLGGNLGSIFGARITSALHLGSIAALSDKELHKNMAMSLFFGVTMYGILAIVIYGVAPFLHLEINIDVMKFLFIFILSGVILTIGIMCIILVTAFLSFKRGIDPDNTVIPVVTTLGDSLGIISLLSMIWVMGI